MSSGRTVRLFFVDGIPTGLITAEIHNWTGHILMSPRDRIQEAFARKEASKTGVYLLLGDEDGLRKAYVGEADVIAERIRAHARDDDKEFWEQVCFITSKDSNLTKAHVRYLESKIVAIGRNAGRISIVNKTEPAPGYLSESDVADMEYFLSQLQILLPALGVDLLRPKPRTEVVQKIAQDASPEEESTTAIELFLKHESGADARAIEVDGEIVVLKGSRGSDRVNSSNGYANLRTSLIQDGRLLLVPGQYTEFLDDVAFASPSAAAAVVNNRNSAGPREWRLSTGQMLKDWREQQVKAAYEALEFGITR
jgi:hypothetical protein